MIMKSPFEMWNHLFCFELWHTMESGNENRHIFLGTKKQKFEFCLFVKTRQEIVLFKMTPWSPEQELKWDNITAKNFVKTSLS